MGMFASWFAAVLRKFRKPKPIAPCPPDDRRLIPKSRDMPYSHYVRLLRDSFPDDDRLRFGWGNFIAGYRDAAEIFSHIFQQKKTYISMETPLIGRHVFDRLETRSRGYFRVGFYNTSALSLSEFNFPQFPDRSRLDTILASTQTALHPYRTKGKHVIYALQVPSDTSLQGLNVFEAAQYDLIALRNYTQRPIIVTVSPTMIRENWARERLQDSFMHHHYACLKYLCAALSIKFFDKFEDSATDSNMLLKDCWCVVCHSSGFATDALLAGVPAITLHSGNFVHPICSHNLKAVECPTLPDRVGWLSRLAYCQWTLEEIRQGECYRHFQPLLDRLLTETRKKRLGELAFLPGRGY